MTAVMIGSVAGFVVLVVAALSARRVRRRKDSVGRFSAATDALKHMADQPPVDLVTHPGEETPSVHVLQDIGVLRLERTRAPGSRGRGREPWRPDADVLARRPLIASLPAQLGSDGRRAAGDAAE